MELLLSKENLKKKFLQGREEDDDPVEYEENDDEYDD